MNGGAKDAGATGATGEVGEAGATGAATAAGEAGAANPPGAAGEASATNEPGEPGAAAVEWQTGTPQLRCAVVDGVGVLTLNRPEARNALSAEMKQALAALLPRLGADTAVGCVLLTGAGAAFCAGGDTKLMARQGRPPAPRARKRALRREHAALRDLYRLPKPTLAALPGPAAGAGLGLALACDLRFMAESAFIRSAYARLALSGDYGVSWFLTRLAGAAKARELMFAGERVSAQECLRLGLANRVLPDAALRNAALNFARHLALGPPRALRRMKRILRRAETAPLETVLALEADAMVQSATDDDYLEAVRAFQQQRAPRFSGR